MAAVVVDTFRSWAICGITRSTERMKSVVAKMTNAMRLRAFHGDRLRASALGQPIELDQLAQQRLHLLQRKHIGTVGQRLVGILVRLDE